MLNIWDDFLSMRPTSENISWHGFWSISYLRWMISIFCFHLPLPCFYPSSALESSSFLTIWLPPKPLSWQNIGPSWLHIVKSTGTQKALITTRLWLISWTRSWHRVEGTSRRIFWRDWALWVVKFNPIILGSHLIGLRKFRFGSTTKRLSQLRVMLLSSVLVHFGTIDWWLSTFTRMRFWQIWERPTSPTKIQTGSESTCFLSTRSLSHWVE